MLPKKLNLIISACSSDSIVLTETWLQPHRFSNELSDPNLFIVYGGDCRDPTKTRGGGVLIALRSVYESKILDFTSLSNKFTSIDIIGVSALLGSLSLVVIAVYIPLNTSNDSYYDFVDELCERLVLLSERIVTVGDFNAPKLLYTADNQDAEELIPDRKSLALIEMAALLDVNQCNGVTNDLGRYLGLVDTNISCTVLESAEVMVPVARFRPAMVVSLSVAGCGGFGIRNESFAVNEGVLPRYNFGRCDHTGLYNNILSVDWPVSKNCDLSTNCNNFYRELYKIIDSCVPKITKKYTNYPAWFDKRIINEIKLEARHF